VKPTYQVELRPDGMVYVNDRSFLFCNFVYGSIGYDEATDKFPDSVHERVWELYRASRGQPVRVG
jgi:hypothetical protein